ncbi:MAG TPA: 23S rRNA (uracil(1939)-C(5))-methyltransferase RlmD [Candidatus Alectryocaccobium stercorigallinarum]|nr:23S rRNA (uracil(1939)-C(5))-methyltransferase RlmD [Candidatus Alectryocaccobium stercorigallinarum]
MISKNDVFTIEITDQDDRGQGIGKTSGFPLFVRHAVMGDVVKVVVTKVKKTFGFARIVEFIERSPYRVEPACPVYKRCGGCQLQNMDYAAQLEFKKTKVRECLRRIGGFSDIEVCDTIGAENIFRYRNKAQYPVGMDKDGKAVCGFFAERTHEIIKCDDCLLSPEDFGGITASVLEWLNENGIRPYDEASGKGLVRHIFLRKGFASGETALCLVINGKKLPFADKLLEKMSAHKEITGISYCVNTRRDNVILGDKVVSIFGREYIEDMIGDIRYHISPLSFYQVNPEQTKKLYDKAVEFASLSGSETIIDLYCGIGTIGLYAARNAKKVYGIEIIPQAIEDAKENAKLNGLENAEFYAGAAEDVLPELYANGLKKADVVIVDPPRKGCDEKTLSTIADIAPDRIVYVSCNPATLARDLKFMKEKGYEPVRVQPVDMFPMSVHCECVVRLERKKI